MGGWWGVLDSKTLIALLLPNIFLIFYIFYAYKSSGHDPTWYFSCLCRKFNELRVLLFLRSTQISQNLKSIQKCPCLSSLKNKFQWTQKHFWPLNRKILIWTFWDCKSSLSKKSASIRPWGVIGAPLLCIFKRCTSWESSVHFFRGPCTIIHPVSFQISNK